MSTDIEDMNIGFVGQGWLGKNYADFFEGVGYTVVRYSKEPAYIENKEKIASCDVVFIAVPTPSTKDGFDASIVREAVKLVPKGKIAVIKSTVLPGTARKIQEENPDVIVLFSPEFLREATVRHDIENPDKNIIGTNGTPEAEDAAKVVMQIFAKAPYERICSFEEAELTKYGANVFLFWKVIFVNMLYDVAAAHGSDWDTLTQNLTADPRIGTSHMQPVHSQQHLGTSGRGAGGHCFIKDFAAFEEHYNQTVGSAEGRAVLSALREKNIHLLTQSGKDLDLLTSVYGVDIVKNEGTQNEA
jgi:UDPglucose 6-dehydrogenase